MFTWNNPPVLPAVVCASFDTLIANGNLLRYVFQEEVGAQGTRHYQGWLRFKSDLRMGAVLKMFNGAKPHLEAQRGSNAQADAYCSKVETRVSGPWEGGVAVAALPTPGTRNDLSSLVAAIRAGSSDLVLLDSHPGESVKYDRGIERVRRILQGPRNEPPVVICLFGGPGVGKTRDALEFAHRCGLSVWIHPGRGGWFSGYEQQQVVILDEVDKWCDSYGFGPFLRLLDRYPTQVEIKGSYREFNSKFIFLCASVSPRAWFPDRVGVVEDRFQQVERRITHAYTKWLGDPAWLPHKIWHPSGTRVRSPPFESLDALTLPNVVVEPVVAPDVVVL